MPTYCFETDDGEVIERFYSIGKAPDEITVCGKKAYRCIAAEHGAHMRRGGNAWPIESEALGVHPDQVREAMDRDRKNGFRTNYTKDGRLIVPDRKFRRDYCKAMGFFDRDAGYGDAAPQNG